MLALFRPCPSACDGLAKVPVQVKAHALPLAYIRPVWSDMGMAGDESLSLDLYPNRYNLDMN